MGPVVARVVTAAAAVVLLVGLAGCSTPTPEPTARALPDGLPHSVPIAPGRVLAANSDGGEWRVWVRSTSILPDYRRAKRSLVAAGFSTTVDNEVTGSGQGQFCSEQLCVNLNAYDDPQYGRSLGYEIYRNSGLLSPE